MNGIAVARRAGPGCPVRAPAAAPQPRFSAVVIATLALGIGGTTAVFSVMHAVLLAPLPYDAAGPARSPLSAGTRRIRPVALSPYRRPASSALREHAASLTDLAGTRSDNRTLPASTSSRTDRRSGFASSSVTSDYFRTLRSVPSSDRDSAGTTNRARAGSCSATRLWRTRFNGDPSVVGATIQLSAEPYEIAGVASPGFEDPIAGDVDVWLPHKLPGTPGHRAEDGRRAHCAPV